MKKGGVSDGVEECHMNCVGFRKMLQVEILQKGHRWRKTLSEMRVSLGLGGFGQVSVKYEISISGRWYTLSGLGYACVGEGIGGVQLNSESGRGFVE